MRGVGSWAPTQRCGNAFGWLPGRVLPWFGPAAPPATGLHLEEWGIDNPQPSGPQLVVDRALSTSFIAVLEPTEQLVVADRIRAIVALLGEDFDYPYRSEMQVWALRDAAKT